MRKLIHGLALLLGLTTSSFLFAQEGAVDKKPMIEIFTSSTCPPCVSGNIAVDGVLKNNPGKYSLVKYQMNWPATGDPYYLTASAVRRAYYEVSGVPHIRTNGISPGYPQNWTQSHFNALEGKTNISISATATVSTEMLVSSHVEILSHAAYSEGLRVYIIVVEQKTFDNATTNGETEFHNVVQGFLSGSGGIELGALEANQTKTFDLDMDLNGTFTETGNDLSLVVFVQDHASKDVKQSEMVEVSHPFIDYTASFTFYDEDYNEVEGGLILIDHAGEARIENSQASLGKILPGFYSYEAVVPGLFPYSGEFSISDSDVHQELFLEIPPFFFYEDFERSGIPPGFKVVNPQGDYFAQYKGQLVYQRGGGANEALYFVFPQLVIDQASNLSFRAGNSSGRSNLGVGVITDPGNPEDSYTEIINHEIFYPDHMHSLGARLDPTTIGSGYLCMKFTSEINNFFYLDNILVIENEPGFKVQFQVTDQESGILPEVEIDCGGNTLPTNSFGYATWRNCDPGTIPYQVRYKGQEIESGELDVTEDLLKKIVYNTSSIIDFELSDDLVYPNPARNQITIRGYEKGTVEIMNMAGKLLKSHSLSQQSNIDISELPEGIYLVKIQSGSTTKIHKLIRK